MSEPRLEYYPMDPDWVGVIQGGVGGLAAFIAGGTWKDPSQEAFMLERDGMFYVFDSDQFRETVGALVAEGVDLNDWHVLQERLNIHEDTRVPVVQFVPYHWPDIGLDPAFPVPSVVLRPNDPVPAGVLLRTRRAPRTRSPLDPRFNPPLAPPPQQQQQQQQQQPDDSFQQQQQQEVPQELVQGDDSQVTTPAPMPREESTEEDSPWNIEIPDPQRYRANRKRPPAPQQRSKAESPRTPTWRRGPARRNATRPPQARWLLSRVFDLSGAKSIALRKGFRASTLHQVAVMVGPIARDWMTAKGKRPIDELLPSGARVCTIVFAVPDLGIKSAEPLRIPARGPSEERRFQFTAGPEDSKVKVILELIYRGRIVQSAVLSGVALADPSAATKDQSMRFEVAADPRELVTSKRSRPFDSTIHITSTTDGQLVAYASAAKQKLTELRGLDQAIDPVRGLLQALADPSKDYGPDLASANSVDFLRRAASLGGELNERIGGPLRELVGASQFTHIQVVQSEPDLFVPVEFVYDLATPTNDAVICPNWRKALDEGTCGQEFHPHNRLERELLEVVCPSGFWAVSKVIERQSLEQAPFTNLKERRVVASGEPARPSNRLPAFGSALFAWSDRVQLQWSSAVTASLNAVTGNNAIPVTTWEGWLKAIQSRRPPLLVLLSHTTNAVPACLQISDDNSTERRNLSQITEALVRGSSYDAPVLLLLGCDTAIPNRELYSFAAKFRRCGASVVVGTITSVLGEHAAPVADAIVRGLSEAIEASPKAGAAPTFGEMWRLTRARLLARGELTALCVTAFGNAGWLFAKAA